MRFKKDQVKCIVVFVPNKRFFGANILQIPFFQHIRKNFRDAEIIIWSPERMSGMMMDLKLADQLYLYNHWKDYFSMMVFLWKRRPDVVFNLRATSEGLNLITGLSMARLRIGFKTISPFTLLLNGRVAFNDFTYMARPYLDLLQPLGSEIDFGYGGIKELENDAQLAVDTKRTNICLMPGGGEGEHKKWGIENFCSLGKLIHEIYPQVHFYFVTGPQESEYRQVIEGELPRGSYSILEGGSIPDIVKIARSSVLTIANDCGPSHLAQMCDVNYIGIWGWKNQHPQSRIIKWTIARPNSIQVVAREGDDIKNIQPKEILKLVQGFMPAKNERMSLEQAPKFNKEN